MTSNFLILKFSSRFGGGDIVLISRLSGRHSDTQILKNHPYGQRQIFRSNFLKCPGVASASMVVGPPTRALASSLQGCHLQLDTQNQTLSKYHFRMSIFVRDFLKCQFPANC